MLQSSRKTIEAPAGEAVSKWSGSSREQAVQRMFTAIARYYDLNNSLLSFGLHHRWKRQTVRWIPATNGGRALDLGAGTGDLAMLLDQRLGHTGHVTAMDLNFAMLREGVRKITNRHLAHRILCCQGNAERLTFGDSIFDAITAGFCIRNVGNRPQAFSEIYRVLKPGGRFVCLEFSRPIYGWLRTLYDWYSFHLLPWIGTKVARDHTEVYHYLPASIRTFPDQERLSDMLRQAGFAEVEYQNLSGGIVAIHIAKKSPS
ncbi:MAG: bifunctional demethylmenaquinone methyltransferase/2-methoxy-6-polyprenyl-1,4-benzoquinol methylase UbiE [Nitrospirae bacterium]|nr:bifunctional demethylmenaquinone methyltransferase/2-methoxy-6-polyprenyl-1,4-benzoquinol methylase UbiE [Nitrospirota bacterium]